MIPTYTYISLSLLCLQFESLCCLGYGLVWVFVGLPGDWKLHCKVGLFLVGCKWICCWLYCQNILGQTILLHRSFFQQVDSFVVKHYCLAEPRPVKLLSEKDREAISALDCLLVDSTNAVGSVVDWIPVLSKSCSFQHINSTLVKNYCLAMSKINSKIKTNLAIKVLSR